MCGVVNSVQASNTVPGRNGKRRIFSINVKAALVDLHIYLFCTFLPICMCVKYDIFLSFHFRWSIYLSSVISAWTISFHISWRVTVIFFCYWVFVICVQWSKYCYITSKRSAWSILYRDDFHSIYPRNYVSTFVCFHSKMKQALKK